MNMSRSIILSSVLALICFSSAPQAHADQEFTFDGGKYADFMTVVKRNKARIKEVGRDGLQAARSKQTEMDGTCVDGIANALYACKDIDMVGRLTIFDLAAVSDLTGLPGEEADIVYFNDIWGYTNEEARREYALLGAMQGTIVIEVTNPSHLRIIGFLPSRGYDIDPNDSGEGNFWRDIKVYADHAFIVSEQQNQGIQVLDLKALRYLDTSHGPVALEAVATYDKFSSAHNIGINEDSGFAYAVGTNTCLGGIEMVDISDPRHPKDAGCYKDHGYIHDIQCVNYKGPDTRYHGREICVGAAGDPASIGSDDGANSISVIDVTDKANVEELAFFAYGTSNGLDYSHQGWFTPDQKYYLHDDELDEFFGTVETTTTRIWDMADLKAPKLVAETTNGARSIDHNLYTRGNYSIHSNYSSGLRIFDTSKVGDGELKEVAFFDVRPDDDDADFDGGTWSNYPYFKYKARNMIAVSSIERGFFLLKPTFNLDGDVKVASDSE